MHPSGRCIIIHHSYRWETVWTRTRWSSKKSVLYLIDSMSVTWLLIRFEMEICIFSTFLHFLLLPFVNLFDLLKNSHKTISPSSGLESIFNFHQIVSCLIFRGFTIFSSFEYFHQLFFFNERNFIMESYIRSTVGSLIICFFSVNLWIRTNMAPP